MAVKKSTKLKELVLKIKPLEETKPKRTAKPAKVLVRKIKLTKKAKPKKSNLVKSIKPLVYPVRGQRVLREAQGKQTFNGVYKTRIKVLGIGGGGSSIISEIASQVKKASFIVANTDLKVLQGAAKEAKHFQFGKSITQGLGTGMNPELGEQAAESDRKKIKELLKETDFCILVSCLGGGTGSGASPVFANILKNLGIPVLGIFTLPFGFEGGKRAQIAKDSLEKLRRNLNALVIIPNQKIFQTIDKDILLKEALSTINKALIESLEGLITLIYSPGLIHVDFATLKTTLAGRGRLAYFNTVEIENPNQTEELVRKVVSNPLIPYAIQGAKEVLFNIDGGLNLNIEQVEQIGKTISNSINPRARVAFGISQNKKEGVKITLLANDCKWNEWEREKKRSKRELKEKQTLVTEASKKSDKKIKKKLKEQPPKLSGVQQLGIPQSLPEEVKIQVRRSALKVKEAIEVEEKKILAQEKKWETPAFFR
ncbi:MAG: cell division protein FtsZ [bacterium]|nr:cell division protein FtsZ [bacterium]